MKTKILVAMAAVLVSGHVMAAETSSWSGSGAEYSPDGVQLKTYQISVFNTETAPNVVQSDATITAQDGQQTMLSQTLTMSGSTWNDSSSLGSGGGSCYGPDLCENYISGANGLAYAITVINDGPNTKRELTIVLQNGSAVKVLRDTLTRVN